MRIVNTSGREQSVAGVGTWLPGGFQDIYDPALAEGLLRNPYFILAEDQPEDVDPPVEASTEPAPTFFGPPPVEETPPPGEEPVAAEEPTPPPPPEDGGFRVARARS